MSHLKCSFKHWVLLSNQAIVCCLKTLLHCFINFHHCRDIQQKYIPILPQHIQLSLAWVRPAMVHLRWREPIFSLFRAVHKQESLPSNIKWILYMQTWKAVIQLLFASPSLKKFHQNRFNSLKHLRCFCGQLHSYYPLFLLTFALSAWDSPASGKTQHYYGMPNILAGPFQERKGQQGRDQKCSYPHCLSARRCCHFHCVKADSNVRNKWIAKWKYRYFHSTPKEWQKVMLQLFQALQRLLSMLVTKTRDGLSF